VPNPLTALKCALEQRKLQALTPYKPMAWEHALRQAGLLEKYKHLPSSMQFGFDLHIPRITRTQAPPNKNSIDLPEHAEAFRKIVAAEFEKGRYLGRCSRAELESLIGPFQTSPIGIIPKPGRPGHFRNIQNFSFPHKVSRAFPNPSINSQIDAAEFPTTWGTFSTVALVASRLPPGSQAATRDVAEAYRTIPLHPSQWPGAVVRLDNDLFTVDASMSFGNCPSSGVYGCVGDAGTELFRYNGMGPVSKWVDDHFFVRILRRYLRQYNERRRQWHAEIMSRGKHHQGGRIWFGGRVFDDGSVEEFDEDCGFSLKDLSARSPRSLEDRRYTYNFSDIDELSEVLGILWEKSKDLPFAFTTIYIGFEWNLEDITVSLPANKKAKYQLAILEWRNRSAHDLQDIQKLYGKLLHASLVLPAGRAYLTGLEAMLGIFGDSPFMPRRAPATVRPDLEWWATQLSKPFLGRPIPCPVELINLDAYSDASSEIGVAIVLGGKWRAWRLIPGWKTLDGVRDIAWAEAVGFELLVYAVTRTGGTNRHFKVFGDNNVVVEGWWNHRSHNRHVNGVFRRLHHHLGSDNAVYTTYIPSALNPADEPSRGIYPPTHLLLPPIRLPPGLNRFLVDAMEPPTTLEQQLLDQGRYPAPAAKIVRSLLDHPRSQEEHHLRSFEDEVFRLRPTWDD
jgi:hypothetical protein